MVQKVEQLQVSKQITLADKPLHYAIKAVIFEGGLCYGQNGSQNIRYDIYFFDCCKKKHPLMEKKR